MNPQIQNVGEKERLLSMWGAGALMTCGLLRGSPSLLLLGAGLAYRGYTGHCPTYELLNKNTTRSGLGEFSNENWNEGRRVVLTE
jgi:uncharacterized membrane protein